MAHDEDQFDGVADAGRDGVAGNSRNGVAGGGEGADNVIGFQSARRRVIRLDHGNPIYIESGSTAAVEPAPESLPTRVVEAFGVQDVSLEPLGSAWDWGLKAGRIAFSQVTSVPQATWSAKLRARMGTVPGLTVVQPVLSQDGRVQVQGWRANEWVPGTLVARVDHAVHVALNLEEALAGEPLPEFTIDASDIEGETGIFGLADRAAWSVDPAPILARKLPRRPSAEQSMALTMAEELRTRILPLDRPQTLCHADVLGTTLFSGSRPPAVVDIVPVARPAGYSAALVVVDGLLADAVDEGIVARWAHLPDWEQLLLRALLYRVYAHALLPEPSANMGSKFGQVFSLLMA